MSGNFFKMDNDIFKCGLNAYEFMVYSYLVMKADRVKMTCYPTVSKIALDCGISKSQVRQNIKCIKQSFAMGNWMAS